MARTAEDRRVHGGASEAPHTSPSAAAHECDGPDDLTRAFAARLLAELAAGESARLAERGEALAARVRGWVTSAASAAQAARALDLDVAAWRTRLSEVGDALVLASTCLGVPPIGARRVARPIACLVAASTNPRFALPPDVELAPAGLEQLAWRACAIAGWLDAQRRAGAVRLDTEATRFGLRFRVHGGGASAAPRSALASGHARGTAWSRWPAAWFAPAPGTRH